MKIRLLKKIRRIVQNEVTIYSITMTNGITTGMSIGYNKDYYRGLFSMGDSEQDIYRKAFIIYIQNNIESLRKKYKK